MICQWAQASSSLTKFDRRKDKYHEYDEEEKEKKKKQSQRNERGSEESFSSTYFPPWKTFFNVKNVSFLVSALRALAKIILNGTMGRNLEVQDKQQIKYRITMTSSCHLYLFCRGAPRPSTISPRRAWAIQALLRCTLSSW